MTGKNDFGGAANVVDESKSEEEAKMTNTRKGSSTFTNTADELTARNRNTTKTSSDNKGIRFPAKLLFRKNSAMEIKDESNTVGEDFATSSPARNLFDLLEVQYTANPTARELNNGIDEQCRDDTEDFSVKVGSMAGADEQARQVDDYSAVKISNKLVVSGLPPEPADDLSGNIDTTDKEGLGRKEDEMPDKSISNDGKEDEQDEIPHVVSAESNFEIVFGDDLSGNIDTTDKIGLGRKEDEMPNKSISNDGKEDEQDEIPQVVSAESNFEIVFGDDLSGNIDTTDKEGLGRKEDDIRIKFHLNAMTRKRYFAKTRKTGVGSSELKSEEERTVPYAIPGEKKVDESIGESATSSNKINKWGKKKDKQYKVLKVSVSTDKKKFKTMPPVKMVTGGEEKEHADTNPSKTEEAASQLEIVPSDENVNKGNENESADRDVAKSSQIGVATSELASDAVRRVSLTKSLRSVHKQTQNDASFWSQPPAWMSSDILNAPIVKFNQLMSCTFPCTPHVEDIASDNQATEPDASADERLAKDDILKLLQAKVKHQNQHNSTLSLQITKLKLDNADFTVKVRELDQLYVQTSYEAVRAKEEVDKQRIAHTEELRKMQAQLSSENQLFRKCKKAVRAKWKAEAQFVANTEELCKTEAKLRSKSQLIHDLKSQISQLNIENASSLAKQRAYNEELQQEIELLFAVNIANADEMKTLKDGYFRQSENHNAHIVESKSQFVNATAKCEAVSKLAQQTKEEAEEKINAQTAESDKMETNWKEGCKMTTFLSARDAQLKKQIAKAGPIMHQEKSLGVKEGLPTEQPEEAFVSAFNTMQNINRSEVFQAWVLSSSLGCHVGDTGNIITKTGNGYDNKMITQCKMTEALSTEIANAKKQIPSAGPNMDQGGHDESLGPNEALSGKQLDDFKDISIGRRKMVWLRKLLGPKRESQGTRESPSSIDVDICESAGCLSSCARSSACTRSFEISQASLKQSKSVTTSDSTIESTCGTSEASSSRIDPHSSCIASSTSERSAVQGEGRDNDEEEDSRDESYPVNPRRMILVQ